MRRFSRASLVLLPLASIFVTGCALTSTSSDPVSVAPAAIAGKVFGGQQPVKQSLVTAWSVGLAGYGSPATSLATTTTDNNGNFTFASTAYVCPASTTQVYVTAQGGNSGYGSTSNTSIALAAGLGNCSTAKAQSVNINEVSTAITAYTLAQFFTPNLGSASTDSFGAPADVTSLATANTYTIPSLLNLTFGTVNPNTSTLTIESAKIYSIANTLAACVNSAGVTGACATLFADTAPSGGSVPTDTLQAAVQMALHPYQNVSGLFTLSTGNAPFIGLSGAPNDWTLAVAHTASNLGLGIAANTSSNIDIDTAGRVWFPSNKSGAVGVAYFDPTANAFSGPFGGAVTGAPISSPQYLTIDLGGVLFLSDQASGNTIALNTLNTSQTGYFSATAQNGDPVTGGPLSVDFDNTLFVTLNLDGSSNLGEVDAPRLNFSVPGLFSESPTGLIASYGGGRFPYDVWASSSAAANLCRLEDNTIGSGGYYPYLDANTGSNCISGGTAITSQYYDVLSVASTASQLCSFNSGACFTPAVPVSLPQGIAVDGKGMLWLANSGSASVSTLYGSSGASTDYTATSPFAYPHGSTSGATMTQPYGLAIDTAGNVWVSNAGCVSSTATACAPGAFVLSELLGAAAPTITPLSQQFGGTSAGTVPTVARPTAPSAYASATKSSLHNPQAIPTPTSVPITTTLHPF